MLSLGWLGSHKNRQNSQSVGFIKLKTIFNLKSSAKTPKLRMMSHGEDAILGQQGFPSGLRLGWREDWDGGDIRYTP